MNKTLFLAHDPGGLDAVAPVARLFEENGLPYAFYCVGPAGRLSPDHAVSEEEAAGFIREALSAGQANVLVTGTSWGNKLELEMISACKACGVPTLSILDYWSNYASRFQLDNGVYVYPDHYVVMDELACRESIADGVPDLIVRVLGHPGLDVWCRGQAERRSRGDGRRLLFLSQPLFELYGHTLGFTQMDVVKDLFTFIRQEPAYTLSIKFHPKDDPLWQNQYRDIAVEGRLSDVLPAFDLVIGMNTMGLLHAALAGSRIISYQPDLAVPDDCITNKLGLTVNLTSYQDLAAAIKNSGDNGAAETAAQADGETWLWMDGRSAQRVFHFVKEIVDI